MLDIIEPIWPILRLVIIVLIVKFIIEKVIKKTKETKQDKPNISIYEKKKYLFDTNSEFRLYKILVEIFGNEYFIFPQVNYSHLIKPKKTTWQEERKYRSRIDRKSADFVLCDKEQVLPKLVIELDGGVHNYRSKKARDEFINQLMKIVDLPILHFKNSDIDRNFIEREIRRKIEKNFKIIKN